MSGRHSSAENDYEDDEDDDDPESPDASDRDDDDDDDDATVDCPKCGRSISEYAQQCPRCGAYLSDEEATRTKFPTWVVVTAVVLLAAIAFGWLGGVF